MSRIKDYSQSPCCESLTRTYCGSKGDRDLPRPPTHMSGVTLNSVPGSEMLLMHTSVEQGGDGIQLSGSLQWLGRPA